MDSLRDWHVIAILLLAAFVGCNQQPSPQQIKEKTAEVTADAKKDAKAVAEGLREGWNRNKPPRFEHGHKRSVAEPAGDDCGRGRPGDCGAPL